MKILHSAIIFILITVQLAAQHLILPFEKKIWITDSIVKIDTIVISPKHFQVMNKQGKLIPEHEYQVNYLQAKITFHKILNDTIIIRYIPLNQFLPQTYYHKPLSLIVRDSIKLNEQHKTIFYSHDSNYGIFDDELQKRGSISRGIRIGNNQNMSVSSSLNLQLAGKIGDDFEIVAALSDNQIPFQPSGNTQQIQEFDKIFIQVFNKKNHFTIGDYELRNHEHRFLHINRKAQGLQYIYQQKDNEQQVIVQTSQSVSKGKYNRMVFTGKEGIQGPYKLTGANQEPFIVILAGTERIYMDGKLLIRGEENDYIIDYNTAELTFTARNLITKDSRIVAEFEYSDRNYARFMTFNQAFLKNEKTTFRFQLYHEFDAKNQTLQQELTNKEKQILQAAGNELHKAVVPFIVLDSVRNENQIYYKLVDSIVNGIYYDSILVYSTDSSARYRTVFTYVGKMKGHYVQTGSTANGRVFKWVAPIDGIPQGEFEPIKRIIPPMKHTVATSSLSYQINNRVQASVDISISDYDINTFSPIDNRLNKGLALKTTLKHSLLQDSSRANMFYETYAQYITSAYRSPEHYKSVEYSRDWNLYIQPSFNESMYGILYHYRNKTNFMTTIGADLLSYKEAYSGNKIYAQVQIKPKGWNFQHQASALQTHQNNLNTMFLRHYSTNEKIFSQFKTGIKTQVEQNQWKQKQNDSLLVQSFSFYRWDGYIASNDTSKLNWLVRYGQREDFLPLQNQLQKFYSTQESGLELQSQSHKQFFLKSTIAYRQIVRQRDTTLKRENNLISRNDFNIKLLKKSIVLTTTHENNTTMEPKRQFIYVEVPAGQGIYTWIDYNQNGIKELNEFEVAQYPDQATYLRLASTTLEYTRIYLSKISQTLLLSPENIWNEKKGLCKFLTNFQNQTSLQHEVKTASNQFLVRFLPLATNDSNLLLVNTFWRNSLQILRNNETFGIQYIYIYQHGSQLLIQGIDKRKLTQHSFNVRWNINEAYSVFFVPSYSTKHFESEFFSNKNYHILSKQLEINAHYQPTNETRWTIMNKILQKQNTGSTEHLKAYHASIELRKSIKSDNYVLLKTELIRNIFTGNAFTSVGYEMLEALQPGWNQIYSVQIQRNLSQTMQMVVSYQARAAQNSKTIHTGNIEVRAFF